ncbi:hypothetical protein BOW53_06595 [Solemya pervernicosa gill symbiont]|uniref:DUF4412 domain-containing protein n=2 Tax=Gammaproteobacteria incertae sedis TaxID=118884 RepID=A0A1T2L6S1_9GAMM|nr:hypothetical protein [Candidatus Reidiella endopervernicosa]OOZ40781.1 hypothetical protein BOW53_06595 [Solemya pervernicosa gill symbiont]QKQ26381.1 hypothetical protein HUE57_08880 [Candidatus Reidiella endopervernicosa]
MNIEKLSKSLLAGVLQCVAPLLFWSVSGPLFAAESIEFSAEAVQVIPQRPEMRAKMYVGSDKVRSEYLSASGESVADISYVKEGRRVMLLTAQKSYMERKGGNVPSAIAQRSSNDNPCQDVENVACKPLGRESVHGRSSVKWELISNNKGTVERTLMWLDELRMMPLRQIYPDGTVSELRLLKNEDLNGRETEKWKLTVTRSDGQTSHSFQWFDLELKISIREEMEGGYIRELRDIKVGPQPVELFEIPAGFTKITKPKS